MLGVVEGNIPIKRGVLSRGPEGINETVAVMMQAAMGEYGMRSTKIRALAINIIRTAGIKEKDYYGQIVAIHNYVRDTIYYVKDVVNQETISQPEETAFNSKAEDCDGQTTLEIALLGSIGIRAVPVVIGMQPNRYSHVYLMAVVPPGKGRRAGQRIFLDPIMSDWKAGREAPANKVKAKKIYTEYLNAINAEDVTMKSGKKIPMNISDYVEGIGGFSALGAYAEADDYLDESDEEAIKALLGDKDGFPTGRDWLDEKVPSVTITSTVDAPSFGVDGMMGAALGELSDDSDYTEGTVSFNTVLKSMTPAPQRGPRGTGPLGPMTNQDARDQMHYLKEEKAIPLGTKAKRIPLAHPITPVNPVTEIIRRDPISGDARVVSVRKAQHLPNQAIVLNERSDYQCAVEASNIPKTNFQEAAEIEGLAGCIAEIGSGYALAGLGNADSASDPLDDTAIIAWTARYKACKTAANSKIADIRAKQFRKGRAPEAFQKIVNEDARIAKKIAKRAKKVAKDAIRLEHKLINGQIHRAARAKAINSELDESNNATQGMLGEYLAGGENKDDIDDRNQLTASKNKQLTGIERAIGNLQKRLKRLLGRSDIGSENSKKQLAAGITALNNKKQQIVNTPRGREEAALKWKKIREQRPKLMERIRQMVARLRGDPQARAKIAGKTQRHIQNAAANGNVDRGVSGIDVKSPIVFVPVALAVAYFATR